MSATKAALEEVLLPQNVVAQNETCGSSGPALVYCCFERRIMPEFTYGMIVKVMT